MKTKSSVFLIALAAVVGGLLLQTYQLFFLTSGPVNGFILALAACSFAPYIVCGIVLFRFRAAWPAAIAGCLVLIGDLWMHYSVFIHPRGSTAAVGLLFMPVANFFLILPIGLLIGWFVAKRVAANAT